MDSSDYPELKAALNNITLAIQKSNGVDNPYNNGTDFEKEPTDNFRSFTLEYALAIKMAVSLVGLVGNILIIRTFIKMGLNDSVAIVFFNLALADLSIVLVYQASIGGYLAEYAPDHVFYTFRVRPKAVIVLSNFFFRALFLDVTTFLTVFLAVQRCLCVVKPIHFKGTFTRSRTFTIMAAIWLYCLLFNLLVFAFLGLKEERNPLNNTWIAIHIFSQDVWNTFSTYSDMVSRVILVGSFQVTIIVCIFIMARILKKSASFRNTTAQSGSESSEGNNIEKADSSMTVGRNSKERKVIVQVSIVSTVFILSHTHVTIFIIVLLIFPHLHTVPAFVTFRDFYEQIADVLFIINSSVNVFIYYTFNTKFRQLCFKRK